MSARKYPRNLVYTDEVAGRWILPVRRGYLMRCCDCALVHRMNFRVSDDGRPEFQVFLEPRRTAAARREARKRAAK